VKDHFHGHLRAMMRLLLPALALGLTPAVAAAASADGLLRDAETTLNQLEGRLARIEAIVPSGTSPVATAAVQSRIDEGLIYHQLREYGRAATVLFDVVEAGGHVRHAGYPDALFYLADSLYKTRNHLAAERYFKMVVDRRDPRYLKDALLRLIEISLTAHPQDDVNPYFEQLRALPGAALDPRLVYIHAKTLFFQDRYEQALQRFLALQPDSPDFLKGRYFAAAAYVGLSRHEDAVNTLVEAQQRKPAAAEGEDPSVGHLVDLTLGRLYYELSKFTESVDHYQRIPRESKYFDQALYEVCWTYVKQKQYPQALRSLDILLLALPDSEFAPEARVVQGNLQLRLGEYDDASDTFEDLLDTFGAVKHELDAFLRDTPDPVAHFNQLISENEDKFDVSVVLPPLAASWVSTEKEVERALVLVSDLQLTTKDMSDSEALIERLANALEADNRVEVFEELHQTNAEAVELMNALVLVKKQLNDSERAMLLGPGAKQSQATLGGSGGLTGLAGIEPNPNASIEERYLEVVRATFLLRSHADAVAEQLGFIKRHMPKPGEDDEAEGDPASRERARRDMASLETELQQISTGISDLRNLLKQEQASLGVSDAAMKRQASLVPGGLSAAENARSMAERKFKDVPLTRAQMVARESEVEETYKTISRDAFELGLSIDEVRASATAIRKFVNDTKDFDTSEESEDHIQSSVQDNLDELSSLENELKSLRRHIEFERAGTGLGDDVSQSDEAARGELGKALDAEAAVLAGMRPTTANAPLSRIDVARGRISGMQGRIFALLDRVLKTVDERVVALQGQVAEERQNLDAHRASLKGFGGETQALAGRIAFKNFEQVRGKFHDIVLKADVGLIDVAWASKEEVASRIEGVLGERKDEFKELDADYNPLRKPDGDSAQ